MHNLSSPTIIEALNAVLDEERAALTQGNLSALDGVIERKETLFVRLSEIQDPASDELPPLRVKALRNQALLDAALQGIQAVANRMDALRHVRESLETYDGQGRRRTLPLTPGKVEKRA